jgi:double-stranded uracil-DNA glycosylase
LKAAAPTLPDHLLPGLIVVFVGINPGLYSAARGHYFARRTSRFWPAFSASRLSEPVRRGLGVRSLQPEHDCELPHFGFGLTDLVKRATSNGSQLSPIDFEQGVPVLVEKLRHHRPVVACFHGLTAYRPFFAHALRHTGSPPLLGPQLDAIGSTRLYVVPNPSPANAHFTLADQTAWYDRLAEFIDKIKER